MRTSRRYFIGVRQSTFAVTRRSYTRAITEPQENSHSKRCYKNVTRITFAAAVWRGHCGDCALRDRRPTVHGAAGVRVEDIGRADDRGQEPLELYAERAPRAHGQRPHRNGVHAIPGRRQGELHRSGHVRDNPVEAQHGLYGDFREICRDHVPHAVRRPI